MFAVRNFMPKYLSNYVLRSSVRLQSIQDLKKKLENQRKKYEARMKSCYKDFIWQNEDYTAEECLEAQRKIRQVRETYSSNPRSLLREALNFNKERRIQDLKKELEDQRIKFEADLTWFYEEDVRKEGNTMEENIAKSARRYRQIRETYLFDPRLTIEGYLIDTSGPTIRLHKRTFK